MAAEMPVEMPEGVFHFQTVLPAKPVQQAPAMPQPAGVPLEMIAQEGQEIGIKNRY
jgi:hypothetical protein